MLYHLVYSASVPKSISFTDFSGTAVSSSNSGDALSSLNIHPKFNGGSSSNGSTYSRGRSRSGSSGSGDSHLGAHSSSNNKKTHKNNKKKKSVRKSVFQSVVTALAVQPFISLSLCMIITPWLFQNKAWFASLFTVVNRSSNTLLGIWTHLYKGKQYQVIEYCIVSEYSDD